MTHFILIKLIMTSKSKINIVSGIGRDFSSNLTVGDVTYHVQTEDMGTRTCKIISRVYLRGEVVMTRKTDYTHIVNLKDREEKLKALMGNHHKATIDAFIKGMTEKQKTKAEYLEEVKKLLQRRNKKAALEMLKEAIEKFPGDPFLMSHYGWLIAVVENNPDVGIKICSEAIDNIRSSLPFGSEFFYPTLYLNLGRTYLKNNQRGEAVGAFNRGLQTDPENHDILWELKKIGVRKKPPIPFLKRNNPINKYLGILLSKTAK